MKKSFTLIAAVLLTIFTVSAQAPLGPAMETDLNRIDSLTELLYSEIPSHVAMADSVQVFNIDAATFASQMMSLGSAIPFDFHASVVSQIQYLMRQPSSYFETLHSRMQLYFPILSKYWTSITYHKS